MRIRENELTIYQKVGINEDTYNLLREQKRIQKKSMMRLVKDLVDKEYGGKISRSAKA